MAPKSCCKSNINKILTCTIIPLVLICKGWERLPGQFTIQSIPSRAPLLCTVRKDRYLLTCEGSLCPRIECIHLESSCAERGLFAYYQLMFMSSHGCPFVSVLKRGQKNTVSFRFPNNFPLAYSCVRCHLRPQEILRLSCGAFGNRIGAR